ncbi:MAG: AEC family transporter [Clostridia bacterium]|nr:AEC family transporter [Clostridia bacterium]
MIFTTVLQQVIILFIYIFLGVILTKKGIMTDAGARSLTDFVLFFVTPCVIIKSFMRPFDRSTLNDVLLSFLIAAIIHLFFILAVTLLIRSKDDAKRRVLRYAVVFTNCGYMSLPLQQAVLGDNGVLIAASFIAIFNLFTWTYGIVEISGDRKYISAKKIFFNPGIIGLTVGLLVFLLPIQLPVFARQVLSQPVIGLAALNTPMPMIIIGFRLAQSDLKATLKDLAALSAIVIRLALLPLCVLGGLYLAHVRGDMLVSMSISACAPSAANTAIFAAKYGKNPDLAVNIVSLATVVSLVTMPLLVTLAKIVSLMP